MNLTLYSNSFQGLDARHTQALQHTLQCGSHWLSQDLKNQCLSKNHVLDDTGKNISHLNSLLGDLTGLYWIWKNTDHEFVGTNQYRRFFDDNQLKSLAPFDANTLYVSEFIPLNMNIWEHYRRCHGDIGIKLLSKAIQLKRTPIAREHVDLLYSKNRLSTCNTFFASKKVFDRTCELLFETVFELYHGTKYVLEFIQTGIHSGRPMTEKRLLAFLAERILNVFYYNREYYFGNTQIVAVDYYTI